MPLRLPGHAANKVKLHVITENHAAHRAYRKVGFVDEGRLRRAFRREGEWYDEFVMGLFPEELR